MTGVKEMVRLRGGLCKVEASLQTKITRYVSTFYDN